MSDNTAGESPVSSGGIRGTNAPIPIMAEKERLAMEPARLGYGEAFNALALTPTALGQLGAKTAIAASTAINQKLGYELGSNPEGELFPSITDADKVFAESYSNQANATLSLQAQKLMQDGQLELDKAYKLTPGMIASYEENMAQGLQEIASHAPMTVKPQLENNIAGQLLRTSGQLKEKMIGEQKSEAKSQMSLFVDNQVKQIYESARLGDKFDAESAFKEIDRISNQQVRSGMFTPLEAAANAKSAKQAFYIGTYSHDAFKAKEAGKLEPFLASMGKSKPPAGVSFLEWQQIGQGVLKDVQAEQALEAQNQTLVLSELALKNSEIGGLNQQDITAAAEQLRPAQLNTFLAGLASKQSSITKTQQRIESMIGTFANADSELWREGTEKEKNGVFDSIVATQRQKDPNKPVAEIEAEVAMASGGEIPAFTKHLNNSLVNGTPQAQMIAMQQYLKVHGDRPGNVNGVSAEAKQMAFAMQSLLPFHDPTEASQMAKDAVFGKTKEQKEANDESWNEYRRNNFRTESDRHNMTKKLLGAPMFSQIDGINGLSVQAERALEYNYKALNGNMDAAMTLTKHNFEASYGEASYNGHKEYTYMPINKIAQLPDDGNGVILNDIADQVSLQLSTSKEAFDLRHNDFYYRLAPRPSIDQVIMNKATIDLEFGSTEAKGSLSSGEYEKSRARYLELKAPIDQFNQGAPIIIERVERNYSDFTKEGNVTRYELQTTASPFLAISVNSQQPVIGDYDIRAKQEDGSIVSLPMVTSGNAQSLAYRPNPSKLLSQYYILNGINGVQKTTHELLMEWKEKDIKLSRPYYQSNMFDTQ